MQIAEDQITKKAVDKTFLKEVMEGLSKPNKSLPSKYFYDERGDELFQQIMELDEYYLTRSEYEIFEENREDILHRFTENARGFNLIEFGAGDAYKTRVLIDYFSKQNTDFIYSPVDISPNVLSILEESLSDKFPNLHIDIVAAEYFEALDIISKRNCDKKVILFLGSNIGNFSHTQTEIFFHSIRKKCNPGDLFMIGFDLQKDPRIIHSAYNDAKGITREFNLNLLRRINRELQSNFSVEDFYHYPVYDPQTGEAKSFLVSKKNQRVHFEINDASIEFTQGETIFTEVSRKYKLSELGTLAEKTGYHLKKKYLDSQKYFCDAVLEVV